MAWQSVYTHLKIDIETGALPAGARLPSQNDLAKAHRVSRHAVRRAVEKLSDRGLVTTQQGKGCFVSGTRVTHHVLNTFGLRKDAARQGRCLRSEPRALWRQKRSCYAATCLDLPRGQEILIAERLVYLEETVLQIVRHFFPADRFDAIADHLGRNAGLSDTLKALGVVHQRRSKTRIEARKPTPTECVLLQLSQSQPVLEIVMCRTDEARTPVVVTETITRADLMTVEI